MKTTRMATIAILTLAPALAATSASAVSVNVIGGTTSVLLDLELLEAGAGLTLTGVSDDVLLPGSLGEESVAFGINARDAGDRPTTLSYDTDDPAATVSGALEHTGSVTFNGSITIGDFSISDAGNIVETGALVSDTIIPLGGLFFAVADGSFIADETELSVGGDLEVTAGFAAILEELGLVEDGSGLVGVDVGDFRIEADVTAAAMPAPVPLPAAFPLLLFALGGLGFASRRRKAA
jgi:hypothetical protein